MTSPEVQRSISIFHSEADSVPLPRQEARGVPTWRPGTAILVRRTLGAYASAVPATEDEDGFAMERTAGLEPATYTLARCRSFCQLNYVRSSGDSCPSPEDHIPELLWSNRLASSSAGDPYLGSSVELSC